MKYAFVTGSSSGIGKATAMLLLDKGWQVWGLSRRQTIHHKGYRHTVINLADTQSLERVQFPIIKKAKQVVLINNAGRLGNVSYFGSASTSDLDESLRLNLLAPMVLSNIFVNTYASTPFEKVIINISSGAGSFPIDGWQSYCASKAGLDMATRVLQSEIKLKGQSDFRAFAVAPGIVDTPMQNQIRESGKNSFSRQQQFVELHKQGSLISPEKVALKILDLINTYRSIPDDKIQFKYE